MQRPTAARPASTASKHPASLNATGGLASSMGKYRGLIITIIIVLATIGGIAFLLVTQFPGLIPSHTIRVH
jgi:Trk-type K+ transport system membrane component